MGNEVYANMMEVSCKSASGKTICAVPDVCMTPPQTPATPPGVPIPYPNTGMASDTADGSSSVQVSGAEMMLKNKSYFKKSTGDEAGAAPMKGVVTSKNTGKVYFNMWSMDVKVEGENVVRHLDITTHNHASSVPGNSPPMPYTDGMAPGGDGGASECAVCAAVGSPIDPVLGAKALSGPEDLDFVVPGPFALEWQRSYLSINRLEGWFGHGWRSPLEISIEATTDGAIDHLDKYGRRTHFPVVARGASFYSRHEQLTLSRDEEGRYSVRGADGVSFHFNNTHGARFELARVADRNGNTVAIERAGARTLYVHCSGQQLLELGFDAHRRLVEIVECRGVGTGASASQRMAAAASSVERVLLIRYRYNDQHDLTEVVDRHGECVRRFDWKAHMMVRQVYAGSFEAFYEYVRDGDDPKVARHWDNVGRSWTFLYGEFRTDVTDQDGILTTYHFDDRQRWTAYTDGLGRVTRRGLDRYGNLRALVDPAQNITETEYDEWSNPVAISDATGAITQIRWSPEHAQPVQFVDPLGRTTEYEYDARGNLVAETDASGARTAYRHDERGLVTSIKDAKGGVSQFEYDPRGLLTVHTDCSGHRTAFAYNADGFQVEVTDALGQHARYVRDAFGRIRHQILADGSSESFDYDPAGRLSMAVDRSGGTTRYGYTPDGLVASRTDALGSKMKYRYDTARCLVEVENQVGARYRFAYDAAHCLIEETRFDGTPTRYRYDPAGFLVESIECPGTTEEIHTRYKRDGLGRLLERISDRNHSQFVYDGAGQMCQARNQQSRVDMRYDAAGRLVEEQTATERRTFVVKHSYDPLGNVIQTILPDGRALDQMLYGSGHVHRISIDGKLVCDIERDVLHREIERTQGSLAMVRHYDRMGRLTRQISALAPDRSTCIEAPESCSRIDRRFEYDSLGRVNSTVDRGRERVFGYDEVDRLTRCDDERFAFDAAHNVVGDSVTTTGILNGRTNEIDDKRYRYDSHGRVVEKQVGQDTVIRLWWDDEHRLSKSRTLRNGVAETVHYVYDAFGRRIVKRSSQGFSLFVWDSDRLLQEHAQSSHSCTYLYESNGFVPLAREVTLAGQETALFHYHCDQIGLPRELTDNEGSQVWRAEYSAWGKVRLEVHLGEANKPAPIQPLRFQGQYEDVETGLCYNRHRYYDPDVRGYLTSDPIGLLGGSNLYRYVNDPLSFADPLGLMPAAGNVADTQIGEDYAKYRSDVNSKGGTPDDKCTWLGKNKGKYRPDQVKPTEKAWGCRGSRHCKGGKKK